MTPTRLMTITQKIPKEVTGLRSSLFIHVDHYPDGSLESIRFSEKSKDGNSLDNILTALGDVATDVIRTLREES